MAAEKEGETIQPRESGGLPPCRLFIEKSIIVLSYKLHLSYEYQIINMYTVYHNKIFNLVLINLTLFNPAAPNIY